VIQGIDYIQTGTAASEFESIIGILNSVFLERQLECSVAVYKFIKEVHKKRGENDTTRNTD
jgi:hypothetical protein